VLSRPPVARQGGSFAVAFISWVEAVFLSQKQNATMSTDQDRWQRIKERLRFELGEDVFTSWFGRMEFESVDKEVVRLSVSTRFVRKWVQSHYADRVLAQWQVEDPTISDLELSVRSAATRPALNPKLAESPALPPESHEVTGQSGEPRTNLPFVSMNDIVGGSPLDRRLTFETFIVGGSNTLAHAAAKQIATSGRGDQLMFNPLYIHAAVGLGKTHLLQAIAWAVNNGDRKALYLTAERFMFGFVSALKSQTTLTFKEALRANDVLAIDDLQFLQGRSIQQEFCHTINTLIDAGRQVAPATGRPQTLRVWTIVSGRDSRAGSSWRSVRSAKNCGLRSSKAASPPPARIIPHSKCRPR
jgi:chromosomal replication initiator protein